MIELDEVDSTNSYLRRLDAAEGCPMMLVTADYQSAGRGADTNRWESARGENLLLSLRVEPANLPISRMFALSEATALALAKALTSFLEGQGAGEGARGKEQGAGEGTRGKEQGAGEGAGGKEQGAGEYNLAQQSSCPSPLVPCPLPLAPCPLPLAPFSIKWPNDIYYGDSKVAGILIENDLQGARVLRSVIGIGINVGQRRFLSDAPNPRSLADIVGHDVERRAVLERFMERFVRLFGQITDGSPDALDALHCRYKSLLYRLGQEHGYSDKDGTFRATLTDVEPSGHLVLQDSNGTTRRYAFKEVKYII